ncbi:hypothetical protein Sjap_022179 [Stephania japonica]|uniref:Uncharacterized protein n=1 Tax=Stephania japonica TaxID=461633 RepID=A0AAP0ERI4_9MAGN
MIRKFAFDFYMSIPIWMSNIEEVVKGIVGSRYRLIIKTNIGDNGRWDDALPEDLVRAAYDELASTRLQSDVGEATRATPEQSVDDEAVYLNVAGECSKGRVYGLGSVGRKKRRYGTPGASTSQTPDVVRGREFDVVAEQLRKADFSFSFRSRGNGFIAFDDEHVVDDLFHLHVKLILFLVVVILVLIGLRVSEVGVVGIVEASELGGGYGGFGASGLGAYRGVEDVETDCKAHKVIVKGKQADPLKVLERVREEEP